MTHTIELVENPGKNRWNAKELFSLDGGEPISLMEVARRTGRSYNTLVYRRSTKPIELLLQEERFPSGRKKLKRDDPEYVPPDDFDPVRTERLLAIPHPGPFDHDPIKESRRATLARKGLKRRDTEYARLLRRCKLGEAA